jgi:hypothetical protein
MDPCASASVVDVKGPSARRPIVDLPEQLSASYVVARANCRGSSWVELPTFVPTKLEAKLELPRNETIVPPGLASAVEDDPWFVLVSPMGRHVIVGGKSGVFEYAEAEPPSQPLRMLPGDIRGWLVTNDFAWDGLRRRAWGSAKADPSPIADLGVPGWTRLWTDGRRSVVFGGGGTYSPGARPPGLFIQPFEGETRFRAETLVDGSYSFVRNDGALVSVVNGAIRTKRTRFEPFEASYPVHTAWTSSTDIPTQEGLHEHFASGLSNGTAILAIDDAGYSQADWKARLTVLDADAHERWRVDLGWAVLSPPVEGGEDRVYVTGRGASAFQAGKELWHIESSTPVSATAFADGGVAVVSGSKLRIFDASGAELGALETPDQEAIVTPPAPTSDGSIWIATKTKLYVAR